MRVGRKGLKLALISERGGSEITHDDGQTLTALCFPQTSRSAFACLKHFEELFSRGCLQKQ